MERVGAPFLLIRGARRNAVLLLWLAWLNWRGRIIPPFLAATLWRTRLGRCLLFARRAIFSACFIYVSFPFSIDIHERDNGAVDLVISCAIWPHPQRVPPAFLVSHSALVCAQCLDYLAQDLLHVGNINVRPQLAQWPADISRQNIKGAAGRRCGASHC